MKKILIIAATAGLMSLAACGAETTNTVAENVASAEEANAAAYEEAADNTSNVVEEAILENKADVAENNADAAAANAH